MTKPVALVTGATAGIGREFARQLAASGHDLVLVARTRERLDALAGVLGDVYGSHVEVIAADLFTAAGKKAVEQRLKTKDAPVDVLVNNAGFGLAKNFEDNKLEDELKHLALLVEVPMRLTHAALSQMLPRRGGTIINIASVAGYTPRGTYSAAKAWLLNFSRWASIRYRPSGVTVTAVAPGFVRTEFHERMGVPMSQVPDFLWLQAEPLVRVALKDVAKGKAVSIPTVRYKIAAAAARIVPDRLVAAVAKMGREA